MGVLADGCWQGGRFRKGSIGDYDTGGVPCPFSFPSRDCSPCSRRISACRSNCFIISREVNRVKRYGEWPADPPAANSPDSTS